MTLIKQFESIKRYGYVCDAEPGDISHWDSDDKDHRKQPDGKWPVVGSEEDKIGKEAVEVGKNDKPPITVKTNESALKKIPTIKVKPHNYTDEQVKQIYKDLPDGVNKRDGTRVEFVHSSYGKIVGHQGYDIKKIIPQLKEIYDNSEPIYDSNYRITESRSDGSKHKEHHNFKGYHNYLGKIEDDTGTYYVRFTTQELKSPKPNVANNQFHNAFVSNIELYKDEATEGRTHSDMYREAHTSRGYDKMLAQFFDDVKKNKTTYDTSEVKSLAEMFERIKGGRL